MRVPHRMNIGGAKRKKATTTTMTTNGEGGGGCVNQNNSDCSLSVDDDYNECVRDGVTSQQRTLARSSSVVWKGVSSAAGGCCTKQARISTSGSVCVISSATTTATSQLSVSACRRALAGW